MVLTAGCTGLTNRGLDRDPTLGALSARLESILRKGALPPLDDGADRRDALLDAKHGPVRDYRSWLAYTTDYNHQLEILFEYHNPPIINDCTDDPIDLPWRLDAWCRQLMTVPAGTAAAIVETDFLLRSFPIEGKAPAEPLPFAVDTVAPLAALTNALVEAATIIDEQALGQVSARERELLQFVIPWVCRSGGRFHHQSKGSPDFNMQWGFYPSDAFKAGDATTSISQTPIPAELQSVTALGRYLRALAGQPIGAPDPLAEESGEFPQFQGRVDFEKMREALARLAPALADQALDALANEARRQFAGAGQTAEGVTGDLLAAIGTRYGPILIGGPGANRYRDVRALAIIDLGGDDDYIFTQPETAIGRQPLQVIVDYAGDDLYQTQGVGGPGAGLLGAGILIDRAGNDRYCQGLSPWFAPRAHSRASLVQPDPEGVQTMLVPFPLLFGNPKKPEEPGVALDAGFAFGAGFLGIGVLVDAQGDDLYLGQKFAFGTGFWRGVGVLFDAGGQDVYAGGLAVAGVGINGAFGLLDDRAGDDHYQCLGTFESGYSAGEAWDNGYSGHGIGYGSSWRAESRAGKPKRIPTLGGGVGLVRDAAGNDSYIGSSFGVAAGYAGGLGAIVDDAGDDTYFVKRGPGGSNHSGWSGNHALGTGCHRGVGYLLDRQGNDRYSSSNMGGGAAWDLGIGYLLDLGGDDQLTDLHGKNERGNTGWGAAKAFAVSFHAGGTDTYERNTFGDASAISDGYPGVGGDFAFFFDVGPELDTYPKPDWNNTIRLSGIAWKKETDGREYPQGLGLFLDGPEVLGR